MVIKGSVRPLFRALAALVALVAIIVGVISAHTAISGHHRKWVMVIVALGFLFEFSSVAIRGRGFLVLTQKPFSNTEKGTGSRPKSWWKFRLGATLLKLARLGRA